jgi:hypothetical protein
VRCQLRMQNFEFYFLIYFSIHFEKYTIISKFSKTNLPPLWPVAVVPNRHGSRRLHVLLSGFSTVGSKFLSVACRAQMVSAEDNVVYTGSGLRGVIPYVQCVAATFMSQVCS